MSNFDDSTPAFQSNLAPETNQTQTQSQTNGTSAGQHAANLGNAAYSSASSAAAAVRDHPIVKDLANGPVAQGVSTQAAATSSEFSDLANSRNARPGTAANDTELTHYHSFFYTLLSWKNKRATGIVFASVLSFIFVCRYLPVIRYIIKLTWMSLGVVTIAEASSKLLMGSSVASTVRPRRYYKIPKETLEASLDDLENLINFFVIEIQRIVFAENIPVTAAAFLTAFLTYYLIKIVPFWGMALIGASVAFLGPLIYIENKELIDGHLEHAGNVIGQQTTQIKDLTAQQTSKGLESVKAYTGTATAKAQDLVGSARQRIPSPTTSKGPVVKEHDFPSAPKTEFPAAPQSDFPNAQADLAQRDTEPVHSI